MDRYEDPGDAIPHEMTVLLLNETDQCFGRQPVELFERVRERLTCDRLLVEAHYRSVDDLPDYPDLVQYPIWIVHHSCLFVDRPTQLGSYLKTASFPDETRVVVLLDTDDERMRAHIREVIDREYSEELPLLDSAAALVHYLLGHFGVANPCSAPGLDYLVAWNNKIADTVGPR